MLVARRCAHQRKMAFRHPVGNHQARNDLGLQGGEEFGFFGGGAFQHGIGAKLAPEANQEGNGPNGEIGV